MKITEQETIHLGLVIPVELHALLKKVSKSRGEVMSSFARRAILKELASLSFLSSDEKKALGFDEEKVGIVE